MTIECLKREMFQAPHLWIIAICEYSSVGYFLRQQCLQSHYSIVCRPWLLPVTIKAMNGDDTGCRCFNQPEKLELVMIIMHILMSYLWSFTRYQSFETPGGLFGLLWIWRGDASLASPAKRQSFRKISSFIESLLTDSGSWKDEDSPGVLESVP